MLSNSNYEPELKQIGHLLQQFLHQKKANSMIYCWLKLKSLLLSSTEKNTLHKNLSDRANLIGKIKEDALLVNQSRLRSHYNHNILPPPFIQDYKQSQRENSHWYPDDFEEIVLARLRNIEQTVSRLQSSRNYLSSNANYQDQTFITGNSRLLAPSDSYAYIYDHENNPQTRKQFHMLQNGRQRLHTHTNTESNRIKREQNDNKNLNFDRNTLISHTKSNQNTHQGIENQFDSKSQLLNEKSRARRSFHNKQISTKDWKPRFFKCYSPFDDYVSKKSAFEEQKQSRITEGQIKSEALYFKQQGSQRVIQVQDKARRFLKPSKTHRETQVKQCLNYSFNPKSQNQIPNNNQRYKDNPDQLKPQNNYETVQEEQTKRSKKFQRDRKIVKQIRSVEQPNLI